MPFSESGSSRRTIGATGSALLLAAGAAAFPAHALYGDRVEVFAAENVTYDSNVFRLPGDVDPGPIIGSSSRSDWSSTTSLGVTADLPYSQQRFQVDARGFATRFDRFGDLDYNGYNARANWLWALTSAVTGEVGASQSRTLSSFANMLVRQRDLVTSRNGWANGAWLVTPSWRVHGALTATREEHSTELRRAQDLERGSAEAGLSYVNAQDNRLGVAFRTEHGRRPHSITLAPGTDGTVIDVPGGQLVEAPGGIEFNNEYDQRGVGVILHWVASGHSTIDARADYIKREYDQFTARNYSGPTFTGSWTWTPTAKLTFVTTAQRDIGPVEDINTSFVLVKGISFKPRWAITEKVAFTGNLDWSRWDYRGDPLLGGNFQHRIQAVGLGVSWRPLRKILFQAGWQHEKRESTRPLSDYDVDVFLIEGRIGF